MPKKVIISADSTCDLSPELIKRYDIRIVPLYVNLADKVCRDGVDVTPTIYTPLSQGLGFCPPLRRSIRRNTFLSRICKLAATAISSISI